MSKTTKQYISGIKEQIKQSMCVDGDVHFINFTEVGRLVESSTGDLVDLHGMIFECNDSKRGRFFIAWYKEYEEAI